MKPRGPLLYFYLLLLLVVGGLILIRSMTGSQQTPTLSYSSLLTEAQTAHITSLTIDGSQGTAVDRAGRHLTVQLPASTAQLAQQLTLDGVDVSYQSSGGTLGYLIASLLPSLILLLLIGGFMFYILRQSQGGNNQAMSFGRSRARMITGDKPQVTFRTWPASTRPSRS